MWLNKKEEKIIKALLDEMENSTENSTYELEWESGTKIVCSPFSIYESDNGLEVDDNGFEEYWVVALKLNEILVDGPEIGEISSDRIIEINYHNAPKVFRKY